MTFWTLLQKCLSMTEDLGSGSPQQETKEMFRYRKMLTWQFAQYASSPSINVGTLNPFERLLTFIGSRRLVTFRRLPERQTGEFVARKKTIFRGGKHADDLNVFRKKVVYPSPAMITASLTLISTLKAS